jgi:2,5-diketo-D-gluconate reductase B
VTGLSLPGVGLGTAHVTGPHVVRDALDIGYRFLDTARMYQTGDGRPMEAVVGEALAETSIPRDELVVATKVDADPDVIRESIDDSLDHLGLPSVDLLYVHWPSEDMDVEATMAALEDVREAGKATHLGLSNFHPPLLDAACEATDAPVEALQVELHPLLPQPELRAAARSRDMSIVAYGPLVRGEVFEVPELVEVAEKHDATAAQVSLAWLAGLEGVVPIPGVEDSSDHLEENLAALDLELDAEDLARIRSIDRERRYYPHPFERTPTEYRPGDRRSR